MNKPPNTYTVPMSADISVYRKESLRNPYCNKLQRLLYKIRKQE